MGRSTAGLLAVALPLLATGACALGANLDDASAVTRATTGGRGGEGGGGGGGANPSACNIDCSSIATPDCQQASCDESTGQCVVGDAPDGAACEDGAFCTTNDSCQAGHCVGGPPNTCGMNAAQCQEVTCDEIADTCGQAPAADGSPCQTDDLCTTGASCTNGLCMGGIPNECFFAPVPDDCHVAECDPADGMCKPVVGNVGESCVDLADLCNLGTTCDANGTCSGGTPKDCSSLTQGCDLGVCDSTSGQCTTTAVMNGQSCNDGNACTSGETCSSAICGGGTPVTSCSALADGCCPSNCDATNDLDCSILPSCNAIKQASPQSQDGIYTIDPDGPGPHSSASVYCDMTTDGGGWLLALSYNHLAGQTTPLAVGAPPTDPSAGFGHADLSFMGALPFSELRLYCTTSAHSRVMHFKTSAAGAVNYFRGTGTNDTSFWTSGFTLMPDHTANLPSAITHTYNQTADDRMTMFPFFKWSTYHWGVGAGGRWECDDYAGGPANATLHRVWVR